MPILNEKYITLFGFLEVPRCHARSKRSQLQCCKAAMRGKSVCRSHGGLSTGPKTKQGRKRCAEVNYVHGWETREKREIRAEKFHEMKAWMRLLDDRKLEKKIRA